MPKFALKLCGFSFNFAVHARTDIHPCEQREVVKVSHRSVLGAFAFWFCLWEVFPVFLAGRPRTVSFFAVADLATVSFVMKRSGPVRVGVLST